MIFTKPSMRTRVSFETVRTRGERAALLWQGLCGALSGAMLTGAMLTCRCSARHATPRPPACSRSEVPHLLTTTTATTATHRFARQGFFTLCGHAIYQLYLTATTTLCSFCPVRAS